MSCKREAVGRRGSAAWRALGVAVALIVCWAGAGCDDITWLVPDPSVRYLAFGDSSMAGDAMRSVPDILPELLDEPSEFFAHQGKGGERSDEGLDRLGRIISLEIYPNAHTLLYWEGGGDVIDFMSDVDPLLLLSPTSSSYPYSSRLNEMLDLIQANIESAIAEAQAAGMTVYVATYFSSREEIAECKPMLLDIILPSQARHANDYIALLNERIRQAAANAGAVVVDVALLDDALHADDANFRNCNHLSAQGNEIVAELFADILLQEAGE